MAGLDLMSAPYPVLLMSQSLDAGGSERQLAEIARNLDRSRFTPHVACFRDGGMRLDELRRAGVPVLHLGITSFRSFGALRAVGVLGRYVRENGIQLLHTFDPPSTLWGVPAGRFLRIPIVLSSQRGARSLRGSGFRRRLARLTDRLAGGIVVNSLAVRDSLISEDGVPPSRIHLCYNGIDLDRFHARRQPPSPVGPVVIAFIGVLRPEKGLGTLLEAVRRLDLTEREIHLRLVGWGSERDSLKQQSCVLRIDGICSFGPAAGNVEEVLRGVDIFVLPSLSESFSNSLMEAMSCGCAVVASRVGGNPELVENGVTGLLFPAGDSAGLAAALEALIADPSLRGRLGRNAAETIRARFGSAQSAAAMERIYDSFLR
jgi:glycosyltransferase involved in cell wall biosynthesis